MSYDNDEDDYDEEDDYDDDDDQNLPTSTAASLANFSSCFLWRSS